MEQVMLSKIMVSIAKYNAVADDTSASSDQHAQGLMSCCIFLTCRSSPKSKERNLQLVFQ
jgi:hypothetical protein